MSLICLGEYINLTRQERYDDIKRQGLITRYKININPRDLRKFGDVSFKWQQDSIRRSRVLGVGTRSVFFYDETQMLEWPGCTYADANQFLVF